MKYEDFKSCCVGSLLYLRDGTIVSLQKMPSEGEDKVKVNYSTRAEVKDKAFVSMSELNKITALEGELIVDNLDKGSVGVRLCDFNGGMRREQDKVEIGRLYSFDRWCIDKNSDGITYIKLHPIKGNDTYWYTDFVNFKFVPPDRNRVKDMYNPQEEKEEPVPTPIKAIKQATGLSLGQEYTYIPTDDKKEFLGVIEGFMITKKGIFVVDYNGDIIPASQCRKVTKIK